MRVLTNSQIFDEFMESKYYCAKTTRIIYRYEIGAYLSTLDKPLSMVTPREIEKHISSLLRSEGGKDVRFRSLWVFWSWMKRLGHVSKNYFAEKLVGRPRPENKVLPFVSPGDLDILIEKAPNLKVKALVCLLADSGARVSEVLNIESGDIDFLKREILVVGKGNKERYIKFGPDTSAFLSEYLLLPWPKRRRRNKGKRSLPRVSNIWQANSRCALNKMLARLKSETAIQSNPHAFRRSFAIAMRSKGIASLAIMDMGGWQSIDMVQKYTEAFDRRESNKLYQPVVNLNKPAPVLKEAEEILRDSQKK